MKLVLNFGVFILSMIGILGFGKLTLSSFRLRMRARNIHRLFCIPNGGHGGHGGQRSIRQCHNSNHETLTSECKEGLLSKIPVQLRLFVKTSITNSLLERNSKDNEFQQDIETCHKTAENIYDRFTQVASIIRSNRSFSESSDKLCRAIHLITPETLSAVCAGTVQVTDMIKKFDQHVEKNNVVVDTIISHHNTIKGEEWDSVTSGTDALSKYSTAAAYMGTKPWVQANNMWMENFAVSFFRHGGARKHYLQKKYSIKYVKFPTRKEKLCFVDTFRKDLMSWPDGSGQNGSYKKIRLVDVGSCYNPIKKLDNDVIFDVTALDLFPADPSVLQCDFLSLPVGEVGSDPIIVHRSKPTSTEATAKTTSACPEAFSTTTETSVGAECRQNDADRDCSQLLQLPRASYDVVTMSLVLSYLPTPEQRIEMVRKARQLLHTPQPSSSEPHRAGLLLIAEKESIFSKTHTPDTVGKNKSFFVSSWKEAIANEGFELVKYNMVKTGARCSHLFAFATTPSGNFNSNDNGTLSKVKTFLDPKMWIKQDFQPATLTMEDSIIPHCIAQSLITDSSTFTTGGGGAANDDDDVSEDLVNTKYWKNKSVHRPIGIVGGGIGGRALGNERISKYTFSFFCIFVYFINIHGYFFYYIYIFLFFF